MKNSIKNIATCGVALITLCSPFTSFALVKNVLNSPAGTYGVVDKRDYPIIFVHGAAGSELDKNGTNLWPGYVGGIINDSGAAQMALNSDGKTDCCGKVTATKVLRYGAGYDIGSSWINPQFAPVYQGFYDYMAGQGFKYENPGDDGKVFYDFVYDWRKDNRMWTPDLDRKVNQVLDETKAEKAILIGHSMGGIQIRLYMNNPEYAKKVGGVIFLATPHHGAPQVLWAYTYGYNFGNTKVSDTRMWEVMKNWPAGYQLLPDYPSIQDGASGKFWTMDQLLAGNFYSQQEYQHTIDSATGREATYSPRSGLPNVAFAKDALSFHQSVLGDSVKKYPWVKYYMVAGTGQDTVQYFTADLVQRPGFSLPILQLTKVKTKNGDGTVPAAGAKIDGVDAFVTVVGEHGEIPSIPAAQVYVTQYRKSLNDEDFRKGLDTALARYAAQKLPEAERMRNAGLESKNENSGDKDENLALAIFKLLFFGIPNEEKIKERDAIQRDVAKAFENTKVNVQITASGEKPDDSLYAVIQNFELAGHGNGTVSPAQMTVHVPSYETFNDITSGRMDGWQAYKDGVVTISGSGLINGLKMRFISWLSKFAGK
jgi:pimeloyl-ACP methyl ester carboxylesterase